ncbi:MAG TPA: hypothetical protein DCR93_28165 [Cytophagales bacterium]|nr:hypothetical protein [Cytophagales bacterium]HAP63212.1 hypothetical protein [Cytophagales bacterium]
MPTKIPLLATPIPAGFPSPAHDYMERALDLNELCVKNPTATFMVRVSGQSMEGAQISDGDVLVVDRSVPPADGKVVIAVVDDNFTVKRLRQKPDGMYLEAEHPDYPPQKVEEGAAFEVWGVVTYVIHAVK